MNQNTIKRIQAEYMEPIESVVAGYISDGESVQSIANILEVSPSDIRNICRHHRLTPAPRTAKPPRVQRPESRRRVSAARRLASRGCVTFKGKPTTWSELSDLTGIQSDTIRMRVNRGSTPEQATRSI